MSDQKIFFPLLLITILLDVIIIGGYKLHIETQSKMWFSLLLALVALITYFGLLSLPGGFSKEKGFSESRIRFAITSTLTITYLVYFSTVMFSADTDNSVNTNLLATLTNLLGVVIAFYFGSTAVSDYLAKKSNEDNKKE